MVLDMTVSEEKEFQMPTILTAKDLLLISSVLCGMNSFRGWPRLDEEFVTNSWSGDTKTIENFPYCNQISSKEAAFHWEQPQLLQSLTIRDILHALHSPSPPPLNIFQGFRISNVTQFPDWTAVFKFWTDIWEVKIFIRKPASLQRVDAKMLVVRPLQEPTECLIWEWNFNELCTSTPRSAWLEEKLIAIPLIW